MHLPPGIRQQSFLFFVGPPSNAMIATAAQCAPAYIGANAYLTVSAGETPLAGTTPIERVKRYNDEFIAVTEHDPGRFHGRYCINADWRDAWCRIARIDPYPIEPYRTSDVVDALSETLQILGMRGARSVVIDCDTSLGELFAGKLSSRDMAVTAYAHGVIHYANLVGSRPVPRVEHAILAMGPATFAAWKRDMVAHNAFPLQKSQQFLLQQRLQQLSSLQAVLKRVKGLELEFDLVVSESARIVEVQKMMGSSI